MWMLFATPKPEHYKDLKVLCQVSGKLCALTPWFEGTDPICPIGLEKQGPGSAGSGCVTSTIHEAAGHQKPNVAPTINGRWLVFSSSVKIIAYLNSRKSLMLGDAANSAPAPKPKPNFVLLSVLISA